MEGPPKIEPQEPDWEEKEEQPMTLEEFLKEIDVKTLRSIFEEEFVKSGLDREKLHFPLDTPSKIANLNESILSELSVLENAEGTYNPITNKINVRHSDWMRTLRNNPGEQARKLHTITHELTHAASDWRTGLQSFKTGFHSRGIPHTALNEAVTERLAQEMNIEYIRRTGFAGGLSIVLSSEGESAETQRAQYDKTFGAYHTEREILAKMINIISEDSNIPEDAVWQGFVRSYFEQEDLDSNEVKKLFDEVFHPGFLKKLNEVSRNFNYIEAKPEKFLDTEEEKQAVIDELFDKHFPPPFKKQLVDWFKSLNQSKEK